MLRLLKRALQIIFPSLLGKYLIIPYVEKEISVTSRSILDLGCGRDSSIKSLKRITFTVGVELFKPHLLKSKKVRIHDEYILADVKEDAT